MILSFSGDAFLARRGATRALREEGVAPAEAIVLGEGLEPEAIVRAASQGGLFGRTAVFCDFDEAFSGQTGVKPRADAIDALARVRAEALVVVLDSGATASRQKRYRALGRHVHLPTPRFDRVPRFAAQELEAAGVRYGRDAPAALADLFGEDAAAIASEIDKLAVLDEVVDGERVRALANRPAARSSFDLIERVVAGDAAGALQVARHLLVRGEAPQRVFGALGWQFGLVARAVALRQDGRLDRGQAAAALGTSGRAAGRAVAIAERFDEGGLRRALHVLLDGEVHAKTGGDPAWALERTVLELARMFETAG